MKIKNITGFDVFAWPEFRAFAERLGVAMDRPIRSVALELRRDECPKITIEQVGFDAGAALPDASAKKIRDDGFDCSADAFGVKEHRASA